MAKSITNSPDAFVLMDSMRSIGYSFQAAVCDVIDNSVSAGAKNVWLYRTISTDFLYLEILDDGCGMTEKELFEAMRYGKDKSLKRGQNDLGRFGLGLKSASLSQCKVLTVISKKDNVISAYRWDEDHVKLTKNWNVLKLEKEEFEQIPNISKIHEIDHGTLVLWTDFDVLEKSSGSGVYNSLAREIDDAEQQIELVYHRFMDTHYLLPKQKISFFMNNRKLEVLDPFLTYKKETKKLQPGIINEYSSDGSPHCISTQPFILPFQKDINEEDSQKMGGLQNMVKMQGFYIYRNYRLISYGSWHGIRPASELAKYARILVDIPSELDDKWGIDVKKEKATIPTEIKTQLKKTVEEACHGSHTRVSKRTSKVNSDPESLWTYSIKRNNEKFFEVNKESPLIAKLKTTLSPQQIEDLDFILDSLSATLSYIDVYSAFAENKTTNNMDKLEEDLDDTIDQAIEYVKFLMLSEPSKDAAIKKVCSISPFCSIGEIEQKLRHAMEDKKNV